jgi:hypothetical protein
LQPNSTLSIAVSGTRAGQQGPFSLFVELGARPANERCELAAPVGLNAPVFGSLIGARNDYSRDAGYVGPECDYDLLEEGDVAFRFVPPVTGQYEAIANFRPGGRALMRVLEGPCNNSSVCRAGFVGDHPGIPTVFFDGVAGRNVYIIVESTGLDAWFNLEVRAR